MGTLNVTDNKKGPSDVVIMGVQCKTSKGFYTVLYIDIWQWILTVNNYCLSIYSSQKRAQDEERERKRERVRKAREARFVICFDMIL